MIEMQIGNCRLINGDCREVLKGMADQSINCCVTSPPYFGLRDYGHDNQIGLETTPEEFVAELVSVFREVRRVLRDDGTLWVNLGDSYSFGNTPLHNSNTPNKNRDGSADRTNEAIGEALLPRQQNSGLPAKNLLGIPWRVAFALQTDGWYLRQDIIWHKPNPMPESVTDRCTKSHEYIFLLSKSQKYFYDHVAVKEPANLTGKGNANSFRGGAYCNNATFNNSEGGNRTLIGNITCSKADSFKRSGSKREQPIPNQLYGTHRPDRVESEYDLETRNRRSVWTVATKPFKGAHFATFPPDLIEPCILAGCPSGGTVLDPFNGAATTGIVAVKHDRLYVGIELSGEYFDMSCSRIAKAVFVC